MVRAHLEASVSTEDPQATSTKMGRRLEAPEVVYLDLVAGALAYRKTVQ